MDNNFLKEQAINCLKQTIEKIENSNKVELMSVQNYDKDGEDGILKVRKTERKEIQINIVYT